MNTERIERDNPVVKAMHKAKPARVRVIERGGGAKEVRLTQGRNRWRALADMLEAVAWERVEGLDESGAVLVVCTSDEGDDEGDAVPEQTSERVDDVRALVAMMQKVQADTLREARAIYAAQADAMTRVLDAATESLSTAQQAFDMAIKVQAAAMARGAEGDAPDGVNVMQMLQMAMMAMNSGGNRTAKAPLKAVPAPAEGAK